MSNININIEADLTKTHTIEVPVFTNRASERMVTEAIAEAKRWEEDSVLLRERERWDNFIAATDHIRAKRASDG